MNLETHLVLKENLLKNKKESAYFIGVISKADKKSEFHKKIKNDIPEILDNPKKAKDILIEKGYESLIAYFKEDIVGHIAYQKETTQEGETWNAFHISLSEKYQKTIYLFALCKEFYIKAREQENVKIRFGNTKNRLNNLLLKKLKRIPETNIEIVDGFPEISFTN